MLPDFTPEQVTRFWSRVDRSGGERSCWPWIGYRDKWGYGGFTRFRKLLAHRVAWTIANGPIPDDMLVLHHCDNPPCCNPGHLFVGTHQDNMDDMAKKGRRWRRP